MRSQILSVLAVVVLVTLAGCGGAITDETTTSNGTNEPTPESPGDTPDEPTASSNGTLSVNFINVGQGSSTLIVGPTNETMLIDTGDWSDDGEDVLAYLDEHDIDRIDYLVTTHADADHIGGHDAVIDYLETEGDGVGAVYDPGVTSTSQTYQGYLDAIEEHDVTLYETRAGDQIPFEDVETQVLAPPEGYLANGDRNENSIVLHLGFGQSTFLLPGDGETASEQYLVDEYEAGLNATVLSAGHHGSQSSSGDEFLDVTDPRIAVISSGYDSQYGHPHEEVLERFSQRSIRTYWTATHGNIQLTSNGSAITVATQQDAPTAPLELRDGDPVEPGSDTGLQKRLVVPIDGSAASPIMTDGGTNESPEPTDQEGTISIATIHEEASGDERDNLNDEYIVFENTGDQPLDLTGWSVADAADHTYTFPSGFTLDPGTQVTLHTGSGTDSSSDLYWGSGSPIWNNAGDTVIVRNDSGTTVLQEDY
ncbi:lamin tail domain-containing protein [Natrinema salsiterrestre]|uniref:Lamin tail domain-containing protein n=1 Tax=Natrinema salsiterrestre TaxID=2950540 RepID=A0A9Q4Q565_9EURY|nr:lamin tail domain-containing protein [Natrinema salsiterrestre]MDF9748262.1 lamin tail domain-containing protein [Natrinema salsiterrestre]